MRNPNQQVYGLSCKACGGSNTNITTPLCTKCEQAIMSLYPNDKFMIKAEKLSTPTVEPIEALELIEYAEAA